MIRIILLFFIFTLFLEASEERTKVQNLIDDLKKIVIPAKGKKLAKASRSSNEKIKKRAIAILNLDAMTKRALGDDFRKMKKRDRREFRNLFEKLMLQNLSKSSASSQNSNTGKADFFKKYKVKLKSKTVKQGGYIVVQSILAKKGEEDTSVDYIFEKGKIIDLMIDEESLTENFNEQFSEVIQESGFPGLLKLMRERVKNKGKTNG